MSKLGHTHCERLVKAGVLGDGGNLCKVRKRKEGTKSCFNWGSIVDGNDGQKNTCMFKLNLFLFSNFSTLRLGVVVHLLMIIYFYAVRCECDRGYLNLILDRNKIRGGERQTA